MFPGTDTNYLGVDTTLDPSLTVDPLSSDLTSLSADLGTTSYDPNTNVTNVPTGTGGTFANTTGDFLNQVFSGVPQLITDTGQALAGVKLPTLNVNTQVSTDKTTSSAINTGLLIGGILVVGMVIYLVAR